MGFYQDSHTPEGLLVQSPWGGTVLRTPGGRGLRLQEGLEGGSAPGPLNEVEVWTFLPVF